MSAAPVDSAIRGTDGDQDGTPPPAALSSRRATYASWERGRCDALFRKSISASFHCEVCCPGGLAAAGNVQCQRNDWESLNKLQRTSHHRKIHVTSKSPVEDISVVTLIRTDTTLDHSQKAEKINDDRV